MQNKIENTNTNNTDDIITLEKIIKILNSDAFLVREKNTVFNNLGIRTIYYLISWVVLGFGIQVGNGFFVATCLFISSLLMDYSKNNSDKKPHSYIIKLEKIICTIFFIWSVLGLFGILEIKIINDSLMLVLSKNFIAFHDFKIHLDIIWYLLAIPAALPIIDYFSAILVIEEPICSALEKQSKK